MRPERAREVAETLVRRWWLFSSGCGAHVREQEDAMESITRTLLAADAETPRPVGVAASDLRGFLIICDDGAVFTEKSLVWSGAETAVVPGTRAALAAEAAAATEPKP